MSAESSFELPEAELSESAYLAHRVGLVQRHFPGALGLYDFVDRVEIALFPFGFDGDTSIAMVNTCRDEITASLKHALDGVFGSSFNVNGLGGVLTCGTTGVAAGLSHAPVCEASGRERYVFFSFPHSAVDSHGRVGTVSRPGRPGRSAACGALVAALRQIRESGIEAAARPPGEHDHLDPEHSIMKQRLARRLRLEGVRSRAQLEALTLAELTEVAERAFTADLEELVALTVDPAKADYAVVTGVHVHSWGDRYEDDTPNLELVAPRSAYCVVRGERTDIDLHAIPALTPRQTRILAAAASRGAPNAPAGTPHAARLCGQAGHTTLRESDPPYAFASRQAWRERHARMAAYARMVAEEEREEAEERARQEREAEAEGNGDGRGGCADADVDADGAPPPAPARRSGASPVSAAALPGRAPTAAAASSAPAAGEASAWPAWPAALRARGPVRGPSLGEAGTSGTA